jgi:hypothetical protein
MKHFFKLLTTFHLCLLIVLLPGCGLLMPWVAGEDADIKTIEKDLDDLKVAIRQADTNADGKLGLKEGLIGAGTLLLGVWGRNKMSDKRKAKLEADVADLKRTAVS